MCLVRRRENMSKKRSRREQQFEQGVSSHSVGMVSTPVYRESLACQRKLERAFAVRQCKQLALETNPADLVSQLDRKYRS